MDKWLNFVVDSKYAPNTEGIIPAENLMHSIQTLDGREAYYCAYDLVLDFLKLEVVADNTINGKPVYTYVMESDNGLPTFKQYEGPARPALGLVSFDFDSEKAQESLDDVRRFVKWLDIKHYYVAFSGSKGFHVSVPFEYFNLKPDADLANTLRGLAHELKKHFPTIDTQVYNCNRKFRALNSMHPKTKLYKSIVLEGMKLKDIKEHCKTRHSDFYPTNVDVNDICPQLTDMLENVNRSKRADLEAAGSRDDQTNFERYDKKICIQRLFKNKCVDGERNNTALILVNDMYKTNRHKDETYEVMSSWSQQNGLPISEVTTIIENIYQGRAYYNHGCVDPIKAACCSGKCEIYRNLAPDKRPVVIDAPKSMIAEAAKSKMPKEFEVVKRLLTHDHFGSSYNKTRQIFDGGRLRKQGEDLFFYDEGYWHHYVSGDINHLKTRIMSCYEHLSDNSKLEKTFKTFMLYVPENPKSIDFFKPNPYAINFKNGTLHLEQDVEGMYQYNFKDHSPEDYLTNQIPLDYDSTLSNHNEEFEDMLNRIFEGDEDKESKINAIAEMFGAALLPAFPHLFFLYGVPSSGKSTLCIILSRLLEDVNLCAVQPHQFGGFNMASMAGKLVNMVTDINTRATISDDIVKQIEDRVPVRIERKRKDDIYAPLPSVHIFGANKLPKNFDGEMRAHDRRWTIIQFNNKIKGTRRDYANWVFNKNPQGVLNFAVKGLMKLIGNQGYFSRFKSSDESLEEWQIENAPVEIFFREIESEEGCYIKTRDYQGRITKDDESTGKCSVIKRSDLWYLFREWLISTNRRQFKITSHGFYKLCFDLGYEFKTYEGYAVLKHYASRIEFES